MNGIHDMGGMHGLGELEIEQDEAVFHQAWEGRVFGLNLTWSPWLKWRNCGSFRYAQERIPAADYLRMSYYERWFSAHERMAIATGLVSQEELHQGHANPATPTPNLEQAPSSSVNSRLLMLDIIPAFHVDQQIRVKEMNTPGHTRLPRYTRDKTGTITSDNGIYALQDTDIYGTRIGDFPQHVYTVKFTAQELWGSDGHRKDVVYVDLWEAYLDPV